MYSLINSFPPLSLMCCCIIKCVGSTEDMLKYIQDYIARDSKTPPGGIKEPLTKSVNDALCTSTLFIIKHQIQCNFYLIVQVIVIVYLVV
jgi:hypothetical protein